MSNKATQWKKGQSGNPKGGIKRDWTFSGLLTDALEEEDETGESYKKIITRKLRKLAAAGDMVAIKEVMNRLDGMPSQATDITSQGEKIESGLVIYKPEKLKE